MSFPSARSSSCSCPQMGLCMRRPCWTWAEQRRLTSDEANRGDARACDVEADARAAATTCPAFAFVNNGFAYDTHLQLGLPALA
jgi:hypothetical protein